MFDDIGGDESPAGRTPDDQSLEHNKDAEDQL